MFRLLIVSLITSTGLTVSTVEAGDYASEQLEMMRNNQFESLSTPEPTIIGNSPSSPAIFTPPSPVMGSNILSAPEPPKPISICWVVDNETICLGN